MVFGDGQSNGVILFYPQTVPGYHGNQIWDKMGRNSACVRDICFCFRLYPLQTPVRISRRAEWWCHLDAGRRIWGDSWHQIRSSRHGGLNGKKIPIRHSTRKKGIMVDWGASGYVTKFIRMTASRSFISSDENVFSWYSGKPVYCFVKECQPDISSSVLKRLPTEVLKHISDTTSPGSVSSYESCCTALNTF